MPRSVSAVTLLLLATTLAMAWSAPCACGQTAINSPVPLSTRVVAYTLDASIDTGKKSLDATETLTYTNLTGQSLVTFPFHLYLNAFQPDSTFTSETHFDGGNRDGESETTYPPEKLGSIVITHLEAEGPNTPRADLTAALHFTAPDDHNVADRTVAEVTLARPIAPNDSITFHLSFHDQFPVSIARNGSRRDFLMGGQWFPKLGVFWHGAWNCHQYHALTEFFSDFGTYTVHLTLPRGYIVGASGVPTGETAGPNGLKTVGFYGEDIGDFAWAASPHFQPTDATFLSSLGPVKIHVLALAAHPDAGRRYLRIMQQTLAQFEQRYGPYPYKVLTVIDPEPDSQIGGMEYPTLFTGDTSWFEPTHLTEATAEHEFGHQYWYGMVATNEFEDAWLDEGINTYTEIKVLGAILGQKTSLFDRRWANASDASAQRLQYLAAPDFDPVTRHAWQFRDVASYGGITYGKSAMLLATLEGLIGTEAMDEAMRTYFLRFRFKHPTTEDFLRTLEEVAVARGKAVAAPVSDDSAGRLAQTRIDQDHVLLEADAAGAVSSTAPLGFANPVPFSGDYASIPPVHSSLRPFLDQAVYGTQTLDYAVDSILSNPVPWWRPAANDRTTDYLSTVYLHRKGAFTLPVTLEVVFSDGTRLREHWDGGTSDQARWTKFTWTRRARLVSAEIDPDHLIPLDTDLFNNSITLRPDVIPGLKLSNLWLTVQQLAEQLVTLLL